MMKINKKNYKQSKDKKKICPNCNNKVFNATVICKNIDKDGKTCFYMHQNKRTPEYIREIINLMDYGDRDKYFKLFSNNKNKTYKRNKCIVDIINKIYNPFKKKNEISIPKKASKVSISNKITTPRKKINKREIKNDNLKKNIHFVTKKNCIKNITFIKKTIQIKNKLCKEEWMDDTFDNLKDIESI